jgi:hypothetical protein
MAQHKHVTFSLEPRALDLLLAGIPHHLDFLEECELAARAEGQQGAVEAIQDEIRHVRDLQKFLELVPRS